MDSENAKKMIAHLHRLIGEGKSEFVGKTFGKFTVSDANDFEYRDPIDGIVSKNQVSDDKLKSTRRILNTNDISRP